MKPSLFNKSISGDKINATENCGHVKAEVKVEVKLLFLKYSKESQDFSVLIF